MRRDEWHSLSLPVAAGELSLLLGLLSPCSRSQHPGWAYFSRIHLISQKYLCLHFSPSSPPNRRMQVLLGLLPLCTLESPEARASLSFGRLGRLLWSAKRPLQTPNHPELLVKFRGIGCCDSNFTGPSHRPHLVIHNGNVCIDLLQLLSTATLSFNKVKCKHALIVIITTETRPCSETCFVLDSSAVSSLMWLPALLPVLWTKHFQM